MAGSLGIIHSSRAELEIETAVEQISYDGLTLKMTDHRGAALRRR